MRAQRQLSSPGLKKDGCGWWPRLSSAAEGTFSPRLWSGTAGPFPLFRGETEAKVDTPRKEQQVLLTAEAAVSKACLAENSWGAYRLGDVEHVPECLWDNFSGSPNGNNPSSCCIFRYWRASRTFLCRDAKSFLRMWIIIITATNY